MKPIRGVKAGPIGYPDRYLFRCLERLCVATGLGQDAWKTRVIVERLEIRIGFDAECVRRRESMLQGFSQEGEGLVAPPPARLQTSEIVDRSSYAWAIRPEKAAFNIPRL